MAVTVEWLELRRALNTEAGLNALIDLTVDGSTNLSVVKELQRDPVRRTVTHVDFMLIDRNAPLSVDVPIVLEGEAPKLEAMKGMKWESPRGPISIDPETRDIVQNIYIRKVEKVDGELYNVEFATFEAVKDSGKTKK